ncbi:hypothetical protein ACEYW6_28390 [Nostoc sp. UIC 10607]|uniref:hypothetical protein n=1 Tax=Nostoc sp. UIC 10607 TaxID=3045935 RepID=UPI0039A26EAF
MIHAPVDRTRDRYALGVGGSYGQKDYWLGQLDPASRKSHSAAPTPSHEFLNSGNKDTLTTGS